MSGGAPDRPGLAAIAAAAAGNAGTVRTPAWYLPVLAGTVSGTGAVGAFPGGSPER